MHMTDVIRCDICGQEIPHDRFTFPPIRRRYVMTIQDSAEALIGTQKLKLDICPSCYKRIEEQVKKEIKEK